MRANPGGQLATQDIVGRDVLVARLWDTLSRQSVVLSAERRMGKSHVLWKMRDEAPADRLVVYHDLEGVRTPLDFVELVLRDVERFLSRRDRLASRARRLLADLQGVEVGDWVKLPPGIAPHWKRLLTDALADLAEHEERTVVFFWDELPLMLHNVQQREGPGAAMEVLDVLRQVRQTHPTLRMVFTGSIGIHNVLSGLKETGYANAPLNDMRLVDVPPLEPADAADLARRLLAGEGIAGNDPGPVVDALATATDGIAYYIHYVIDELKQRGGAADPAAVEAVVRHCLSDPEDGWHMAHYRERLDTYYGPERRPLALALLDVLAHDGPLPFAPLFDRLKARTALADAEAERVRDLLTLLQRDHYLRLDADGYAFRFPLIRRWWAIHRG
jgi:hypothetical protein